MPNGHDIIAIGASSGGVEALQRLVGGLPGDLPAAVFVVVHLPKEAPSALARILDRAGPLEARNPEDGEKIRKGRIYVARPDLHLLIEDGRVRLTRGPKENRHRPGVDTLFRSAAVARGPAVVGVVLTGAMDDGTAGLSAVKRRGGVAVVQDPDEALFSSMPASALRFVDVDHCLPLDRMAPLISGLAREPVPEEGEPRVPDDMNLEVRVTGLDPSVMHGNERPGELSGFTCPECTGPLHQIEDGEPVRLRCRVGHAYAGESMRDKKAESVKGALHATLKTLEENAMMAEGLASSSRHSGHEHAAARFETRAREAREQAEIIRRVLVGEKSGAREAAS